MIHIRQIRENDQIICYMRTGLALRVGVNQRTKEAYRYVPSKPERVRNDSLEAFYALVLHNDLERKIIRVQVTPMTKKTFANNLSSEVAEIPWNVIQRMRLYSKVAYEGHAPLNPSRTTSMDGMGYWQAAPYHTVVEVNLYDNP